MYCGRPQGHKVVTFTYSPSGIKKAIICHLVDLLEVVLHVEPRHGGRHLKHDGVGRTLVMGFLRVEQLHPEVGQVHTQLRVAPAVQWVTENCIMLTI